MSFVTESIHKEAAKKVPTLMTRPLREGGKGWAIRANNFLIVIKESLTISLAIRDGTFFAPSLCNKCFLGVGRSIFF